MCCCSTWYSECDLLKGRNLAFSLKPIFIWSPNICGGFQRLLFWMNTEHLTMFWGLLMLETNFSIKASLQNTQNYFLKSNSETTHRDVSFSHKDVSGTSSQGHVLVMPTERCRQAQEPLLLSKPPDTSQLWSGRRYSSICWGFGHVNLGTVLQAKELCSRCIHLFKWFFFFSFPFPEFPLTCTERKNLLLI